MVNLKQRIKNHKKVLKEKKIKKVVRIKKVKHQWMYTMLTNENFKLINYFINLLNFMLKK